MTYLGRHSKMEGETIKLLLNPFVISGLFRFLPLASPLSPGPLLLLPNPGLRGGKGGFGSLLRAIGAQVETF